MGCTGICCSVHPIFALSDFISMKGDMGMSKITKDKITGMGQSQILCNRQKRCK